MMDIYQYFQMRLKAMRDEGATNRELAKRAGVSHVQINRMLNQPSSYLETVGLKTLVLLCPDVFNRILRDAAQTSTANGTGATSAINSTVNVAPSVVSNKVFARIVHDKSICNECKLKFMEYLADDVGDAR